MGKRAFPPLPALYAVLFCCLFTGVLEAQPFNDLCDDAELLLFDDSPRVMIDGDTADGATDDPENDTCGNSSAPGLWYAVEGNGDWMNATTCAQAQYDTRLSVFSVPGGKEGVDIDNPCAEVLCVVQNDDACGLQSTVRWLSEEGGLYYILVHGYNTQAGVFSLTVEREAPPDPNDRDADGVANEEDNCPEIENPDQLDDDADGFGNACEADTDGDGVIDDMDNCPDIANPNQEDADNNGIGNACDEPLPAPENDKCDDAIEIAVGDVVEGSTTFANTDADLTGVCNTNASPSVWFLIEGTGDAVIAETCGSTYDTYLSVFEGDCDALTCIQANDDSCGLQSSISFQTTPDENYFIRVFGFAANSGDFVLTLVDTGGAQENETCLDAELLDLDADGRVVVEGNTLLNLPDPESATCGPSTAPGVWYVVEGVGERMTAQTCGSTYDTRLSVFDGDCDLLNCIASNDDFCGLQSTVEWLPVQGELYFILVHGFSTRSGNYILTISDQGLDNGDLVAPGPPEGLLAVAGADWVELDWDDNTEEDLASYKVYRSSFGKFPVLNELIAEGLTESSYVDDDLPFTGIAYQYMVSAIDSSGNESDPSISDAVAPGVEPGGGQVPSDFNQDSQVDISDAIALFSYLFLGQERPACPMGLDFNGDTNLDISDGIGTLGYLFQGGVQHALGTGCLLIEECPDACAP
jgi:hypothetical protein